MEKKKTIFGARQLAYAAVLLAICILSQAFKNLSVFITGPIVNACLALAVLTVNLPCAVVLSVIAPVTAWLITGNPLMSALPAILLFIMGGNLVLVVTTELWLKKRMLRGGRRAGGAVSYFLAFLCALVKGAFMGATISLWLLPTFLPAESPLRAKLPVFQTTFSLYQFLTACIGFVYVFVIWAAFRRDAENGGNPAD